MGINWRELQARLLVVNMNSQDSGYSSSSSISGSAPESYTYDAELDHILEKYEIASKMEKHYLLYSEYSTDMNFRIGCGLSPARTFSSVITLAYVDAKISFSTYEWDSFIDILKNNSFINTPLPALYEEYKPETIRCGDYCTIRQIIFDDVKWLEVTKHGISFLLRIQDVLQIIQVDNCLISHRLTLLESLNFCEFYRNVIEIIRNFTQNNGHLSKFELLYTICDCSNSIMAVALREFIYFYKPKVVNDLD